MDRRVATLKSSDRYSLLKVLSLSRYRYTLPVLLEMAVAVEESAKDFYTSLASKFSEHEELFEQLAKDEEDHAERYTHLLGRRRVEEVYSTEEERMLADHNIQILESTQLVGSLRRGAERAREVSDLKSAVKAAVQLEKDTLLFYQNLAMGLGKEDRQEVYRIIRVEHSHLYKVQNLNP